MMKRLVLGFLTGILAICFLASDVQAQNEDIQQSNLYRMYQMKYIFASKYNDPDVAKNALYTLLAMDPSDDSLKLRLSAYYFENGQYASSLFSSADIIARNPDNLDALRINAFSYERMGVNDKAISAYESLYLKTNEIDVLYQVAILQYDVERYQEALTNLDIIIANPQAKVLKLNFSNAEGEDEEALLEAAAYNVKGMIEKAQGNSDAARQHFQKSMELSPDFSLPKTNLQELE
jgi:tetratricopeptide (TPR) repeat protein